MTPKEKHGQMVKLKPMLLQTAELVFPERLLKKLRKATRFPAFAVLPPREFEGMGKWTIVVTAECKSSIKKDVVCIRAYQPYHVTHAKNPLNNGTGIYLFNADDYGNVNCQEFPPHYFNRLRERLIAAKGMAQPDFPHLVLEMMRLHSTSMDLVLRGYHFHRDEDGMYTMERDHDGDKKEGFDNLITYHREGASLGVSAEGKRYFNFTTFVPNGMLREGQSEMQRRMMAELRQHEYRRQQNPFATYDRKEWIEKGRDI